MPQMKSLAPVRIASRTGHVVVVTPEGSFVPDVLVPEAFSRGCVLANDAPAASAAAEPSAPSALSAAVEKPAEPPSERLLQIREAVAKLIENNDPADFTATGIPRVAAVRRVVDDSVTSEEIAEAMLLVKGR